MRVIPIWRNSMSDGCSVPGFLRKVPRLAPLETPDQCKACLAHDRDYYFGGTPSQRAMADERLRRRLIDVGMPAWRAGVYWAFVRVFGGPRLHWLTTWTCEKPVAWANGGAFFRYSDEPAGEA